MRAFVLALSAFALPAAAWACPSCAGRSDGGVGRIILLAAVILLPFVVFFVARSVIRRHSP